MRASLVDDRCLENEELHRYQHQEEQSEYHFPNSRHSRRDKTIEARKQQRVKKCEDAEGAEICYQRPYRLNPRFQSCSDHVCLLITSYPESATDHYLYSPVLLVGTSTQPARAQCEIRRVPLPAWRIGRSLCR